MERTRERCRFINRDPIDREERVHLFARVTESVQTVFQLALVPASGDSICDLDYVKIEWSFNAPSEAEQRVSRVSRASGDAG